MTTTKRRLGILLATVLVVSMIPVAVIAAGGTFTDDDDSIFEPNIEWLAGAGVTLGCNPPTNDNFCPDDNVTRGQMAAFMQRFAQFLGAEDGTVSEADHAATADSATTAEDSARLAGRTRYEYQPALFAFQGDQDVNVTNGVFPLATATVTTGSVRFCPTGQSPQADILVRASGTTLGVSSVESATFVLQDDAGITDGTLRRVSGSDGSFAMAWLYSTGGGTETFTVIADEISGDAYQAQDVQITVEVVQDTRCEGMTVSLSEAEPMPEHPDLVREPAS